MAVSRYSIDPVLNVGRQYGTARAVRVIRNALAQGSIESKAVVLRGGQRLDILAGSEYGDSSYWWILAAASNIGWGLQVPAGTVIIVPKLEQVIGLLS